MWISLMWSSQTYNSLCPALRGIVLPAPNLFPLLPQPSQMRPVDHFTSCLSSSPSPCSPLRPVKRFSSPPLLTSLWNLVFLRAPLGFPGGSVVKNLPVNVGATGDMSSNLGSGRSPGERNGNTLQDFCLGNPMDRGAWQATVCGVAKSWTRLSN